MKYLKHVPTSPEVLAEQIEASAGQVSSKSLFAGEEVQMTLFAFAEGESVSEEQYPGDTFYYVLEGVLPLMLDDRTEQIHAGECVTVPAGELHAIGGAGACKFLQINVRK